MQIIDKKLAELKPYENNPRNNDEAAEYVANSIKEFGFKVPIVIDSEGVIVAGHTRLKAAERLGLKTVPCIVADDLTPEQVKAFRLADNKAGEIATWDFEKLDIELSGITDIDMTDFGFENFEIEDEAEPDIIEDEPPEPTSGEPKAKRGDVYRLGRHRLMCGDSTSIDDVEKLINGEHIQVALTDPPYGVRAVEQGGHNSGKKAGNQVCNDNIYFPIAGDETTETAQANYDILQAITDNQIIFGGNYLTNFLPPSRCWIVWDKDVPINFADGELAFTSFDRNLKIYKYMWSGMRREGERKAELSKRVHPTQKPVGLFAEILSDFSEPGDNIIDCFGGSGSTLIACEQTNRNCYMMELEPHYVDVIIERWENFTGQKAKLISEVR